MDVIGEIAEKRDHDDRGAEDVFIMNESCIGGGVSVALGFETPDVRIGRVDFDIDDAMGDDGFVAIGDIGDDVANVQRLIIDWADVNHRADGKFRFHGSGHDRESAKTGELSSDKDEGDKDDDDGRESAELREENFKRIAGTARGSFGGRLGGGFKSGGKRSRCGFSRFVFNFVFDYRDRDNKDFTLLGRILVLRHSTSTQLMFLL